LALLLPLLALLSTSSSGTESYYNNLR